MMFVNHFIRGRKMDTTSTQSLAIHKLMKAFEAKSPQLFSYVSDDIDLRIDHYDDMTDVAWQSCTSSLELQGLLGRLMHDVFPEGTRIDVLKSQALGAGWTLTLLEQTFWYAVTECTVRGKSYITSHEQEGKVDFFREIVYEIEKTE